MNWTLSDRDTGGVYTFVESGDSTIARLHTVSAEQQRNAKLIHAAPELLAALEAFVAEKHTHKAMQDDGDYCQVCGEYFTSERHYRFGESAETVKQDAIAAIAKAKS